jgi:hypothetical protein
LRGGWLIYELGTAAARSFTLTNNLLERIGLVLGNFANNGGQPEQVRFWNNLFNGGCIDLNPPVGNTWVIRDNLFDRVDLTPGTKTLPNSVPLYDQHHNGYVWMSERWLPTQPTSTDPNLTRLFYQTGPLGRYYLRTSESLLLNKGSRRCRDAGLYHFTSLITQTKEGNESQETVNIGLHYVSLADGKPADSDKDAQNQPAPDGVPDCVEDRNGDGWVQSDEPSWLAKPAAPLRILPSVNGSTVSGIARIPVELDNGDGAVVHVLLSDEAGRPLPKSGLSAPFSGPLVVEWDTRTVANGPLTLAARASRVSHDSGGYYDSVQSDPVTVTINNPLTWPRWEDWTGDDAGWLRFWSAGAPFNYTIWVYEVYAAYAANPQPIATLTGNSTDGNVSITFDLAAAGVLGGEAHPLFLAAVSTTPAGGGPSSPKQPLPSMRQSLQWPNVGAWVVAYEDSFRWRYPLQGPGINAVEDRIDPQTGKTYFHDGALGIDDFSGGWRGTAVWPPWDPAPLWHYPPGSRPETAARPGPCGSATTATGC